MALYLMRRIRRALCSASARRQLVFCVLVVILAGINFSSEQRSISSTLLSNQNNEHVVEQVGSGAHHLSSCDEKVLDNLDKRFDQQRSERRIVMNTSMGDRVSFDIYEPEATCFSEERFGSDVRYRAFGDGPKFICGVDFIARQSAHQGRKCLVYSVGSNNNVDFEKAVHTFMNGCEIHTFDPTLSKPFVGGQYATFHPWGLGEDGVAGKVGGKVWEGKSFETIIRKLGHENRTIDILKIDCEGCEWVTMVPLFELISSAKVKVDQILIELHLHLELRSNTQLKDFFWGADKAKMRVFHKERNGWGCQGIKCVEYALASETFLREANRDSICPSKGVSLLQPLALASRNEGICTFCMGGIFNRDMVVPRTGGNTCGSIMLMAAGEVNGSDICATIQKEERVCCSKYSEEADGNAFGNTTNSNGVHA
jgi:hypothetical protein